jgi:putative addiction module component (TIGR02574 family)
MTAAAQKQLVTKALALPRRARASLMAKLRKSLEEPEPQGKLSRKEWNAAWKTELNRRIGEVESGKVKLVPWEDVRRRMERIIGKK